MLSLWILFAVLTGFAVFSVLWPLSRAPAAADAGEGDVAFYRAQAIEIERDVQRGTIRPDEAEAAKAEAARRLLASAGRGPTSPAVASPLAARAVALGAILFVPAVALMLYAKIGRPDLPDMPLAARLNGPPAQMDLPTAVARIEQHLAAEPNDGRGYEVLVPTYMRLGRPDDAVRAARKALALLGATADRYAGLGEAQVYAGGGVVTVEAKSSFDHAQALDPASPRASYYLGLAALQDGDGAKALATWRALAAESPPNAPWLTTVNARIAQLANAPSARVDDGASLAAAIQSLPDEQRQTAIRGMVDRLADRLKSATGDLDGWMRLVRAYRVLDEAAKARDALAAARRSFAADATATKRLDVLAQELGLEG